MKKCSNCRVGRESLACESETVVCPYIEGCIKNKFCYYEPVEKRRNIVKSTIDFFKKLVSGR